MRTYNNIVCYITSPDEKKRALNVLRNAHHFKESDKQLQLMRDKLKNQRQQKNKNMEKRKKERIENGSEYKEAAVCLCRSYS